MSLLVNRNRFGIGLIDTTKSAFYGWGVKGATQAHLPPRTRSGHFNPRARKGRDSRVHRGRGLPLVSIHAPVKGATRRGGRLQDVRQVSIHAPTRGATPDSCHKHVTFEFQSTRPQGARPHVAQLTSLAHGFNPRARKGRDRENVSHRSPRRSFNPRARKGRDRTWARSWACPSGFNPRARKGRDVSEEAC